MNPNVAPEPDWDIEQLEVILEPPTIWQLVTAGPGAGKSAVACQRIAYLVDEAVPPSKILLISFTRTAVAELRSRIASYAAVGLTARSVRIATIDSHAWSLRTGFDEEPLPTIFSENSYELGIDRTVALFKNKNPDLMDFMARLEHLIVDEAQDVMGVRAELVMQMLASLPNTCGVTILADPAQAIYGFTTDNSDESVHEKTLLERLAIESPRPFLQRTLKNIHRIKNKKLIDVFVRTRKEIDDAEDTCGHVARVQQSIRDACATDIGDVSFPDLALLLQQAQCKSALVLFRRRADVLAASSYCSQANVQHRLRMSNLPVVIRPWLGWLFCETTQTIMRRDDFDRLWELRAAICPAPLCGEQREDCWSQLHRIAAGSRPLTLDLVQLRNVVSRGRPPLELCYNELGTDGPILSTIHASKGREAETVILVMPPAKDRATNVRKDSDSATLEEGRVYYVGATRARALLLTADNALTRARYLDTGRVYRPCGDRKVQFEVGREGDVDPVAHFVSSSPLKVQHTLASLVGKSASVTAWSVRKEDYDFRIRLEHADDDGVIRVSEVGKLSRAFSADLGRLWTLIDQEHVLKPAEVIPHLYLAAIGTVGLTETDRLDVSAPFSQSGLGLAPVIKGFPTINFLFRRRGRHFQ